MGLVWIKKKLDFHRKQLFWLFLQDRKQFSSSDEFSRCICNHSSLLWEQNSVFHRWQLFSLFQQDETELSFLSHVFPCSFVSGRHVINWNQICVPVSPVSRLVPGDFICCCVVMFAYVQKKKQLEIDHVWVKQTNICRLSRAIIFAVSSWSGFLWCAAKWIIENPSRAI